MFSRTETNDIFEVYHEPIKSENNRWGPWSKWHRIAFPPSEFEVQFTETISVMAIWEPWLSLLLQVNSLLDDACTVWNALLISLVITFTVRLNDVIQGQSIFWYWLSPLCLLVFPHLFPSLLCSCFIFEGEPTHLPQLSWSPRPPMTDRARI